MNEKIDLTGVDLVKLIQAAYNLSAPQGLGLMQFTAAPLTEDEAKRFIRQNGGVDADYINGRAVKLTVFSDNGRLWMRDSWYDHTDVQLRQLLAAVGKAP